MLIIKNLVKTYQAKNGHSEIALDGIDLEFENKGFVFIVGKSGCGKSTLLNILGGLDKPSSGTLNILDKISEDFSYKDLDYYRNSFVGFIFQEFNLIESLTVYENVALPLELQNVSKEKIFERVIPILKKLDIDELIYRRINELSGGQIQRVAIARALVKDPQIILADEPTGNLDSKSSKIVLDYLKDVSKDKLVIMVTHEQEWAKEYADRIIELKDGRVLNDSIVNSDYIETEIIEEEVVEETLSIKKTEVKNDSIDLSGITFKSRQAKFPFIETFKMALINLFNHKIRFSFNVLIYTITLIIFAFTLIVLNYDSNYSVSKTFKNANISSYNVQYCDGEMTIDEITSCLDYTSLSNLYFDYNLYEEVKEIGLDIYPTIQFSIDAIAGIPIPFSKEFIKYSPTYQYEPSSFNGKILLEDNQNFTLTHGEWADNTNEAVITDFMAMYLFESERYQEHYRLNKLSDLINNKIISNNNNIDITITGIIETNYQKYQDMFTIKIGEKLSQEENRKMTEFKSVRDKFYTALYISEEAYSLKSKKNLTIYPPVKIKDTNYIKSTFFNYEEYIKDHDDLKLYPNDLNLYELKDDEFIIPLSDLWKVYEPIDGQFSVMKLEENINLVNEYIGLEVSIKPFRSSTEIMTEEFSKKLVGVIDDRGEKHPIPIFGYVEFRQRFNDDNINIYVNDNYFNTLNITKAPYTGILIDYPDTIEKNTEFLNEIENKNFIHNTAPSLLIYNYEATVNDFLPLLTIGNIIFTIFTIILIISFISFSIIEQEKEIGILRSLGTKVSDISKIFIYEGLLLSIISSSLAIILVYFGCNIVNNMLSDGFRLTLYIYDLNVNVIVLTFAFSLTMVLLSSIIPIHRITKKKPIDAIRKN